MQLTQDVLSTIFFLLLYPHLIASSAMSLPFCWVSITLGFLIICPAFLVLISPLNFVWGVMNHGNSPVTTLVQRYSQWEYLSGLEGGHLLFVLIVIIILFHLYMFLQFSFYNKKIFEWLTSALFLALKASSPLLHCLTNQYSNQPTFKVSKISTVKLHIRHFSHHHHRTHLERGAAK